MTDELTGPSAASGYPARLATDYPEDGLNRLTTAFRLFMLIPIRRGRRGSLSAPRR